MDKKNNHNDNLNLEDLPRQNNFKIPENYFEGLASSLENELQVKDNPKKRGVIRNLVVNISIAAAVVIGVFIFKPDNKSIVIPDQVAQSQTVYVEDYLISMVESADEWMPLDEYELEMGVEIELEGMSDEYLPSLKSVTAGDLEDYFEDEDYYEI